MRERIVLTALVVAAIQGCGKQANSPSTIAAANSISADASPPETTDESRTHGYSNSVNRLVERRLTVQDEQGKPAVFESGGRAIQDVELQIVWTSPSQFGWNYSLPELHGGKDYFESEYPSTPLFLQKKLGAKTFLDVSVPDTPYWFYIINGHCSPFFWDSEKDVIWQLKHSDLEKKFPRMRSVSGSSKRIIFEEPCGDGSEFVIIDFSDRQNSPKVSYHGEGGLP